MTLFRAWMSLIFLSVLVYTGVVVGDHGLGLLPIFFGAIGELGWPGQFNLDFSFMLSLSALWVAYRHRFGAAGLLLGTAALFGGSLFLSAYLLVLSVRARGDVTAMLLGERRAEG